MHASGQIESSKWLLGTSGCRHYRTGTAPSRQGLGWLRALSWILMIFCLISNPARAEVELEECVGAWLETRNWINELQVPEQAEGATSIPGASAVCIILRHRGRTVGVGRAHAGMDPAKSQALVHQAAMEAIEIAQHDDVIAALPDSVRREAGTHLTMEMEIASSPQALLGKTFQEAADRLRPGMDGLAMRHDEQWWFQFPSHLRLTNAVAGPDRLYALALASDLSPQQIDALRAKGDLSIYRFSTLDLAQATPQDPPVLLVAGDLAVVEADVTSERLCEARDALARHILERIFTTDDQSRLVGPFLPSSDGFDPKPPSNRDRFLVALALARYAHTSGVDPDLALEAEGAARLLLRSTIATQGTEDELDPMTAAAWCLVADQLEFPDREAIRLQVRAYVQDMLETEDTQVRRNAHDLVFAAAGLAGGSEPDQQLAAQAARRARETLPIQQHIALLPWLGWIKPMPVPGTDDTQSDLDRTAMWLIREQVLSVQAPRLGKTGQSLDSGGFRLQPGTGDVTAQSLRPGLFLTETMDDPSYFDRERDEEIQQGYRSFLRYLLQLTCRDDVAGTWRQPERVKGGIRNATWDAKLHPVAQAMGLMVLSKATDSQ